MSQRRALVLINGLIGELPAGDQLVGLRPQIVWTGELGPGAVLTCLTPFVDATFQWRRDGADISGATSETYTIAPEDSDAAISCDVTGTRLRSEMVVVPEVPTLTPGFPAKPTHTYLVA